jgi:hypothetical protein
MTYNDNRPLDPMAEWMDLLAATDEAFDAEVAREVQDFDEAGRDNLAGGWVIPVVFAAVLIAMAALIVIATKLAGV